MEESEYDVEKMHIDFTKRTNAHPGEKIFEALDNCINETKDLTEKCEKSFALTECFIKAEEKIYPNTPEMTETHEEHEH
ncbi:PREDICTED: pheromone-binding protein Gp-9-like [Wasmannia auropunctata]|uniref:pheromone-binding protein Gp-9-like n=1 Tax=Wasmannia auropunctata TaxID=64793 RepID=UPI0005ED9E23|nr:PREDICTED: pheromone-binding protein Gp-9-like [Wasmannia auropunctata]